MNIDNCPYCKKAMKKGRLAYRYAWRAPRIIFEDGSEKVIQKFNPFSSSVIDNIFYCDKCEIILGHVKSKVDK